MKSLKKSKAKGVFFSVLKNSLSLEALLMKKSGSVMFTLRVT